MILISITLHRGYSVLDVLQRGGAVLMYIEGNKHERRNFSASLLVRSVTGSNQFMPLIIHDDDDDNIQIVIP